MSYPTSSHTVFIYPALYVSRKVCGFINDYVGSKIFTSTKHRSHKFLFRSWFLLLVSYSGFFHITLSL